MNRMLVVLLGLASVVLTVRLGSESDAEVTARIARTIRVLADECDGRRSGTSGARAAARSIASQISAIDGLVPTGVAGSWLRPVTIGPRDRRCQNVVAELPGADAQLGGEVIVVGAHYDHLGSEDVDGVLSVFHGADDNASGCAALIEVARTLASQRLRRTVVFHWYTGEEQWRLGSLAYVADPDHPLEDTILMINLDMVGRLTAGQIAVRGTGSVPGLVPLLRARCEAFDLNMREEPFALYSSDQRTFYESGIPALAFFTGQHDDWHQPSDVTAKINVAGVGTVAGLVASVVAAVDGADGRPAFEECTLDYLPEKWKPRLYTGAVFTDAGVSGATCEVSHVVEGSPADDAGLRVGDAVRSIDGDELADRQQLAALFELDQLTGDERETYQPPPMVFDIFRPGSGPTPGRDLELEVLPIVR